MNIIITIVAAIIVITGIFFSQRNRTSFDQGTSFSKVLSESEEQSGEQLEAPSPTNIEEGKSSGVGTITKSPTPTYFQTNLSDYKYPNSQTVSSTANSLLLNSPDNSDTITDWYKEKIRGEGMNVKTFVTTKTNDNVLNKLVGADGNKEIRIEIKKEAGNGDVEISVKIEYF